MSDEARPFYLQAPASSLPWWRTCDVDELRAEVEAMDPGERDTLVAEINVARANLGTALTGKPGATRGRMEQALTDVRERQAFVAKLITEQQNKRRIHNEASRERVLRVGRERLAAGDVHGALTELFQWVEGFGRKS